MYPRPDSVSTPEGATHIEMEALFWVDLLVAITETRNVLSAVKATVFVAAEGADIAKRSIDAAI